VAPFGANKNETLGVDAVIFFDVALAGEFAFRCKRGGHLVSKMQLLSGQRDAYLADRLWLADARHANRISSELIRRYSAQGDGR
jgi:threonine aldolase